MYTPYIATVEINDQPYATETRRYGLSGGMNGLHRSAERDLLVALDQAHALAGTVTVTDSRTRQDVLRITLHA